MGDINLLEAWLMRYELSFLFESPYLLFVSGEIASVFLDDYFSSISKNHDFPCSQHKPIVLTSTTTKSIPTDWSIHCHAQ